MMDGWEKCPRQLIRDRNVSSKAVRLFLLLKTFSGPKGCFPSQQELAGGLDDCAEKTVRRCLDELRKAGYIQTRRKWIETPQGPRQTCEYVFVDASKVNGHQSPLTADSERTSVSLHSSERTLASSQIESERTSVSLHSSERTLASSQIESERTFGAILNGHDGPCNRDLGTETKTRDSSESLDFTLEGEKPEPALKVESLKVRQDRWFAAFWGAFIHRPEDDKGGARREFRRLVKSETTQNLILSACKREREARLAGEPQYRRSAREWLKSENWRETPEAAEPAKTSDPWDDIEPINARRAVQ